MSGLSSSCSRDCSGRGECYNGTCLCDIRFTGELCDGPNLPYHTGIGGVFFFISIVCAIQLITCIISEYGRLKAPSLVRACKVTTQKLIYFVICLASLIRGAYFIFPESFEYGWSSSLLSSYYPLLMSSASLIVCFWAEVFHLPGIRWDRPQFLSKSYLAFITFNLISFSLLIAEAVTTQLAKPPPDDPRFYNHLFNGCYAVLMFIIVVFFLIYGVEVYFKVRGGFITKPLQLAGNNFETQPLRDEPDLRNKINLSQLHQSRIGLLSQALMLIIISGFLFSETLSEFWKTKVPINSRNLHNIIFRVVEIGVAIWFPAVLWNCMQPSELWILNPSKLLAKLDHQHNDESTLDGSTKLDSDDEAFLDRRECWICYDGDKKESLIQPCDCTGDVSSVHHECLRRWLMESASASNEPLKCKVCQYEYDICRSNEVKWDKGFTAHHWGSTAFVVTCMCVAVAGAWIFIQLYDNSYIRMASASVALIIIYVCIRMYYLILLGTVVSSSAFLDSYFMDNNCSSAQFACRNGKCVDPKLRCDTINNCGDGTDEMDCEHFLCEEPRFHRCKNHRCISKAFVCDGENDCEDFSDEVDCANFKMSDHVDTHCEKGHWQCADKLCIPDDWVCNGEDDCLDGSDELVGCTAKIECDGFKCRNGHCVPIEWRCDGNNDCQDKSDEEDCENHVPIEKCTMDDRKFLCSNNKTCIDLHLVCDGHPHCPDKSDEGPLCNSTFNCTHHGCSHDCVQLPTGPKCLCPSGYNTIDDKHCQDINECEQFDICDQTCQNTPGSYECHCDHKYFLKEDRRTCKAVGGEALMIFSSKTEIRAFTLDSELYFPVAKNLKQVVGIDYDGHHVYWTDIFAEHESIVRSLEDGSEREILITSGVGLPEDLSVDWLTGNIYFTDAEKQHIGVCTSDGIHCTVLVNKDISKPRGIVLNVEIGEMYWTDWDTPAKICNSQMDGSNDKIFVSNDIHWPNGLAIDIPNQRLYWTDAKKMTLESIRLDGTDRRIVLKDVVKHPYAISVFEDRLYWSDWATHSIQTCNKFTGKNHHTLVKENKEFIYGISIFHSALHKRVDNPCALSFCSDICLLKGDGYRCACSENKVLGTDQHICRDIGTKQMLIAGAKNTLVHIVHQFLGKHDVTSLPTVAKEIGCLAFDSVNNTLLISDLATKSIISLDLDTGASKKLDIARLGRITAMDYDSRGNNLYLCDEDRATLEVINLNSMSRKTLLHDMDGETPEAVSLVPEEGIMFISLKKKGERSSHVDRFYMDGTGRTHGIDNNLVGPVSLYYDYDLHRVFFADAGTGLIESTSVEGDDRHQFRELQTNPVSIATLNNDIFWVNSNSKRLYWGEKKTESNFNKKITLDLSEDPEKLHLISISARKETVSSCRMNNNGCSHLCLLSHKVTVCACPAGWELSKDNRTCVKRVHCDHTEYMCHESNTCILRSLRCNGHQDCTFGEDEKDCEKANKCSSGLFQCDDGECISENLVCNHHFDCKDKSDEHNCSVKWNKAHCPPSHFRCANGNCISDRFLCDGVNDCVDKSDEAKCDIDYCTDTQFRCDSGACIPKSWECDHEYDCADYSDEHSMCSSVTCPPTLHTCTNGRCVDKYLVCDGTDDCGDNSDERTCFPTKHHICASGTFPCTSNASICLPLAAKCNGTSECPGKEDERECSDCAEEEFGCSNGKCVPVQWRCDGLDDCGDGSDEGVEQCSRSNKTLAGVVGPTFTSCVDGFRCKSGDCIHQKLVCNGNQDCYDGSDEGGMCSISCEGKKNPCSQICLKTPTGPSCACQSGYKMMGNGFSCMDINECQNNPPVCSQLCHNNNGGHSCDCYKDFQLRSDKKSCKAEGYPMSLIFITEGQIRELTQKSNIMSIVFASPVPKISGLDVLLDPKSVYFSIESTSTIHRIDTATHTRHYIKNVGQPQTLAVDWSTRNVYYYNAESNVKSINICNFEEKCAKLIDIDIHRQVSAIVVDSVNKVMFYSVNSWWVFNAPSYVIYRCNLDGSDKMELVKTTAERGEKTQKISKNELIISYVTDITFDYNKKNLYFLDQHTGQISSMTYEGKTKTPIFFNVTRSTGLKFFENHLFYSGNGGMVAKCRLYDAFRCESFRLHHYPVELFTIAQKTVQPPLENVCEGNTCAYMCVPGETSYRCLCPNGTLVARNEICSANDRSSENDGTRYRVHSVSMRDGDSKKHNSGAIAAAILVPLFLLFIAGACFYNIKKKSNGGLSVSMRFYNPIYGKPVDDEHPILQPGQHEYSNPVHFSKEDAQMNVSDFSKKSLDV